MWHYVLKLAAGFALGALFCPLPAAVHAEAIIDLSLGGAPTMAIAFDGTELSTVGAQNSPVQYEGFLSWLDDLPAPGASFTLQGLTASGPATVMGSLFGQQFTGGSFSLYHPDTTLLLSGDLSPSGLVGTIGQPNGTLFTTSFGTVTGGSLATELIGDSLVLQMHLWNVNGGTGFSAPVAGELGSFTAAVTVDIEGQLVPEPSCLLLVAVATGIFCARRPRRG